MSVEGILRLISVLKSRAFSEIVGAGKKNIYGARAVKPIWRGIGARAGAVKTTKNGFQELEGG